MQRLFKGFAAAPEATVVNFLGKSKRIDWRFETWKKLQPKSLVDQAVDAVIGKDPGTIYWIGTIFRPDVAIGPGGTTVIRFFDGVSVIPDAYWPRTTEGRVESDREKEYGYHLPQEMKAFLLEQMTKDHPYFQVALRETVNAEGEHKVFLLWNPGKPVNTKWGTFTQKVWIEEPYKEWGDWAEKNIPESIKEEEILSEPAYHWLK